MALFLNILKSILYGIVQGITEWLPISSTGHLILLESFLPMNVYGADAVANLEFWEMYKVVIQFGSIIAVLLLYFNRLNPFNPKLTDRKKRNIWRLWLKICIASIPAAILGLLLDDWIDAKMSTPFVIALALIIYGIAFIVIEKREHNYTVSRTGQITPLKALQVGAFQVLALIPGTSRSGSTILGETLLGFERPVAAEFSFYMAIPVMFGASLLKMFKMKVALNAGAVVVLLVGMVTAFAVSVFAIRTLMTYIRKHDFTGFGYYRIVLGVVVLLCALLKVI